MRYMLTGDHWSAEEAYRMGEVQKVVLDAKEALEAAIQIANRIADCGPLGIQTTLASAHLAIDHTEKVALSRLDAQFGALFHTQGFVEGRKAEAEGRRLRKEDVFINLVEVPKENWSYGNGLAQYVSH